jgi:uncharacterized protein (TIGR02001 family)
MNSACREWKTIRAAIAVAAAVWLAMHDIALAQQQPVAEMPRRSIVLGSRGGPAGDTPRKTAAPDESGVAFSAAAAMASDYIYRGVTLSDRGPAAGANFETAFDKLYASITVASVKLPTDPSAEISFAAGLRPTLGNIELDLAWTFYSYPNEKWWLLGPTGGTDYWEASLRAETQVTDALRIGGGFAWSPNISNTGAWGQYIAAGLSYDLPRNTLPGDIGVSVSGSIGYSRFGNMDDVLGGFPLPAYTNWNAGATFTYKTVSFDLRYYDTNLSQEKCYVFTGATDAVAGGATDPLRNPEGLRSRWCGATFVAKLVFSTN